MKSEKNSTRAPRHFLAGLVLLLAGAARAELAWPHTDLTLTGKAGEKLVAAIPFRNVGATTVKILAVQSSCDCTSAAASAPEYLPGTEGAISVEIVPKGAEGGRQATTVRVLSSDSEVEKTLTIVVNVTAAVTVQPSRVLWELAESQAEKQIEVRFDPAQVQLKGLTYPDGAFLVKMAETDDPGRKLVTVRPTVSGRIAQAAIRLDATVAGEPRTYLVYAAVR